MSDPSGVPQIPKARPTLIMLIALQALETFHKIPATYGHAVLATFENEVPHNDGVKEAHIYWI
jgi:hypothetical protein